MLSLRAYDPCSLHPLYISPGGPCSRQVLFWSPPGVVAVDLVNLHTRKVSALFHPISLFSYTYLLQHAFHD